MRLLWQHQQQYFYIFKCMCRRSCMYNWICIIVGVCRKQVKSWQKLLVWREIKTISRRLQVYCLVRLGCVLKRACCNRSCAFANLRIPSSRWATKTEQEEVLFTEKKFRLRRNFKCYFHPAISNSFCVSLQTLYFFFFFYYSVHLLQKFVIIWLHFISVTIFYCCNWIVSPSGLK